MILKILKYQCLHKIFVDILFVNKLFFKSSSIRVTFLSQNILFGRMGEIIKKIQTKKKVILQ